MKRTKNRPDGKHPMVRLLEWILFFLTAGGPIADEAVDAGILDLSGEGRDKYGK